VASTSSRRPMTEDKAGGAAVVRETPGEGEASAASASSWGTVRGGGGGYPRSVDGREQRPVHGARRRYFAELGDGLRFVRSRTLLLSMILVATVGNFFDQPLLTVVAPVYANQIYGSPASLGALVGSFGVGPLAGSLLFGSVGRRWPRRRTYLTSYLVGPP
jgi:hypothetical protein